jgi:serine/threonine protein kinase
MMEDIVQDYYIKNVIIEEVIGTMYLGVHQPTNTKVTIQLINPSLTDELFYHNLSIKNNALVSLNHPAIGKFYKYIKQEGQIYLISEYVPNATTLLQYAAGYDQPMAEEKILYIFKQIVDAFEYAHSKGVNHFAVHPDNIRIVTADQVKVVNFGVASLFVNHLNKSLPEKLDAFNIHYRSPEHVMNRDLDLRSDIYSLGVLLFELITRQTLYPSALLVEEINDQILHQPLPPINVYTQAFADSHTMQAIVDKATAKDPALRFQDFRELKESLFSKKNKRKKIIIKNVSEQKAGKQVNPSEKILTRKLANPTNQRKPVGKVLWVVGLIIMVIAINLYFNYSFFTQSAISLREKINEIISSYMPTDRSTDREHDDANENEPDSSALIKQQYKAAKKELSSINKPAASNKNSKAENSGTTISQKGSSGEIHSVKKFSKDQLQNRLEAFYLALGSKDINQVSGYYASKLTKFFNESNVTNRQLQGLLLQAWKRTPEDKYEILWDTFRYDQDQKGNYTTEFSMNYVYRRANTSTWRSQKIYTIIKMDNDLKIYYMSGD